MLVSVASASEPIQVDGFKGLAEAHCKQFPIELIWRMATGRISEIYGPRFKEFDGYIRKHVGYGTKSLTKTTSIILDTRG